MHCMTPRSSHNHHPDKQNDAEGPSRLLELNVTGRYQMNWGALRSGTRVNFQKSSLLRNAGACVDDVII